MKRTIGRIAVLTTVIMMLVSISTAGMVTAVPATPNDAQDWDNDKAVNPYLYEEHVVVNQHNRSEMSSPLEYYDDSGDVQALQADLNDSIDNPVKYRPDKVDDEILSEFPRKDAEVGDNAASAIDDSEWSKTASSAGSGTISSTSVEGVDAVQFSTSSQTDGDTITFTYDNFTIDSDATKRVPLMVGSVDSLDTGATVYINFTADDGDVKSVTIDSSANADDADVAANGTANGLVWQQRLEDISTVGTGDGDFAAIDSIEVVVADADATVTFTGMDAERKSQLAFGEHLADTDDDDELETVTTYENADGGVVELSSMSTLPSQFDDATIYDLEVWGLMYEAQYLDDEDVYLNWSDATNYPNFDKKQDASYRLSAPAAIDLEHYGLELRTEQAAVSDRYLDFRYAEGTGDTEPGDIDSWTDASGDLASVGDELTLDSTIQAGQNVMFDAQVKYTQPEYDALYVEEGGTDTAVEETGFFGGIMGWFATIAAGLLGFLGLRKTGE